MSDTLAEVIPLFPSVDQKSGRMAAALRRWRERKMVEPYTTRRRAIGLAVLSGVIITGDIAYERGAASPDTGEAAARCVTQLEEMGADEHLIRITDYNAFLSNTGADHTSGRVDAAKAEACIASIYDPNAAMEQLTSSS
jgi:hypothetical protein